ncbi:NAD(P)-binding protein [Auricularia subglabra TFB-10046 SS5]|nr:NAD(P)-binding protein [Auricularia subglabra TFB-10046 SS5]
MAQNGFTVLILGVSGYVGGKHGSLLVRLVERYPNAHFIGLVRSESAIPAIRAAGCHEVIQGTHTESEKIRVAANQADLVLNIADCDDVGLMKATLEGMKLQFNETGKRPVLIHTSGTGMIMDKAPGVFNAAFAVNPYDDGVEEHIKTRIRPEFMHRNVDDLVFGADTEGYVDGRIIAPAVIYGLPTGPLPRESRPIPIIVDMALKEKHAVKVGDGTATWDNIHIDDLLDLYELLIEATLDPAAHAAKVSPYTKFYFAVSERFTWGELTELVAKALHELGALSSAEVKSVTVEEAAKIHPWGPGVGTNSFSIATRAKALGWKPKHLQWRQDVKADVEFRLKNKGLLRLC